MWYDIELQLRAPYGTSVPPRYHYGELTLRGWTAEAPQPSDWFLVFRPSAHKPAVVVPAPSVIDDGRALLVGGVTWYGDRIGVEVFCDLPNLAALNLLRADLIDRCGFVDEPAPGVWGDAEPLGEDVWRDVSLRVEVCGGAHSPEPGRIHGSLTCCLRIPFAPVRRLTVACLPQRSVGTVWSAEHESMSTLGVFEVSDLCYAAGGPEMVAVEATGLSLDAARSLYLHARLYGMLARLADGTVIGDPAWPVDSSFARPAGPGDLVQVPLPDGKFGYIHYQADVPSIGPLVSVIDRVSAAPTPISDLQTAPYRFGPLYAAVLHGTATGRWQVVGRRERPTLGTVPMRLYVPPLAAGESADPRVNPTRARLRELPGSAWGWRIVQQWDHKDIGPRLPESYRHLEMAWHWPCEDLEYRIMTGTSAHLERMREFE